MDEPESLGAISLAGREKLDNLIFVINCNLQRLDGPVRGNGKIIQELEADFRGAGWNVIKVHLGLRLGRAARARTRPACCCSAWRNASTASTRTSSRKNGAYVREHFFGKYPETAAHGRRHGPTTRSGRSTRGGHDPVKVYAAYTAAVEHKGQPTVILAKTVKGYGMGEAGEGQNITHQQKKMGDDALREFRDRFSIPVTDEQLDEVPFLTLRRGQPGDEYLRERRAALGGYLPARRREVASRCEVPPLSAFERAAEGDRGPRDLDHDGVRADSEHAAARQGRSASASCRSCPTRAAPSAWRACSASSASSARSASSTGRRTPTS